MREEHQSDLEKAFYLNAVLYVFVRFLKLGLRTMHQSFLSTCRVSQNPKIVVFRFLLSEDSFQPVTRSAL